MKRAAMKTKGNSVYSGYWMDKWDKKSAKKASHKIERQAAKKIKKTLDKVVPVCYTIIKERENTATAETLKRTQ